MGIEADRLHLVWASAAEGLQLAGEITNLVERVRALGPLNWNTNGALPDVALEAEAEVEVAS
jgi:F420-non-reducing hydrogenase iron-sulfur subunit